MKRPQPSNKLVSSLKKEAKKRMSSSRVTHGEALDLVAKENGYENWRELAAVQAAAKKKRVEDFVPILVISGKAGCGKTAMALSIAKTHFSSGGKPVKMVFFTHPLRDESEVLTHRILAAGIPRSSFELQVCPTDSELLLKQVLQAISAGATMLLFSELEVYDSIAHQISGMSLVDKQVIGDRLIAAIHAAATRNQVAVIVETTPRYFLPDHPLAGKTFISGHLSRAVKSGRALLVKAE